MLRVEIAYSDGSERIHTTHGDRLEVPADKTRWWSSSRPVSIVVTVEPDHRGRG